MGPIFSSLLEADIVHIQPTQPYFKEGVTLVVDQLLETNHSTLGGHQYPTFLGTSLDNIEWVNWSIYLDPVKTRLQGLSGLSPNIAMLRLVVKP